MGQPAVKNTEFPGHTRRPGAAVWLSVRCGHAWAAFPQTLPEPSGAPAWEANLQETRSPGRGGWGGRRTRAHTRAAPAHTQCFKMPTEGVCQHLRRPEEGSSAKSCGPFPSLRGDALVPGTESPGPGFRECRDPHLSPGMQTRPAPPQLRLLGWPGSQVTGPLCARGGRAGESSGCPCQHYPVALGCGLNAES